MNETSNDAISWVPQVTQDGSFTFFSAQFGEAFHSRQGAKSESFEKFAIATQLSERAQSRNLKLLDVCYGLGYNSAAALETIWATNPDCQVQLHGLEIDRTVPPAAATSELLQSWSLPIRSILQDLASTQSAESTRLQARLHIGDARSTIQALIQEGFQADAIFFDPFSPRKCPQLWTVEFFTAVRACLAPDGILATYSRSAAVRVAMQEAGFTIGSIPLGDSALPHEWSQGTLAIHRSTIKRALPPLSPMELDHLQTRAGVPYRDPTLMDDPAQILDRHQAEQNSSSLRSTSSWRKQWGIR